MAKILFLESDKVAIKAFGGIINRTEHEIIHAQYVEDAWRVLSEEKFVDLLIIEISLANEDGGKLVERIKKNPFLEKLPVVVYSRVTQKPVIHEMVHLDIQNYLIKPYEDEKLYIEIMKATKAKWWEEYFDDLEESPTLLSKTELEQAHKTLLVTLNGLPKTGSELDEPDFAKIRKLVKVSDTIGFKILNKFIREFLTDAVDRKTQYLQRYLDCIPHANRLIEERLRPGRHSVARQSKSPFHDDNKKASNVRSVERVAVWDDVRKQIDKLPGYPIIDSVAASFQMAAQYSDIEINVLVDMIQTDPSLTAQVFHYTNAEDMVVKKEGTRVEDPKHAIQILGLAKIRVFADSLITLPEDNFKFKGFDWKDYWMFQVGTAMLTSDIINYLSLQLDPSLTYSAGLTHDIGKVLLSYFYPETYENAIEYAYNMNIFLSDTEKHYFGCDHETVGSYYARKSKFPKSLINCITHYREPTKADPEFQDMVAIVSLADYLCKSYEVGYSGSRVPRGVNSIQSHPSWSILKTMLYSGFSLRNFEKQIEERMESLKQELVGMAERKAIQDGPTKTKARDKPRTEAPRIRMQ